MYFFKIMISTVLLMTVLHKGMTDQNIECFHDEENFGWEIWFTYRMVSEIKCCVLILTLEVFFRIF